MIEVENAWELIERHVQGNGPEKIRVDESVGRKLFEDTCCDLDSPPFDKSLVDGFAIAQFDSSKSLYTVIETVTAGEVPRFELKAGEATRIMTGCPVPKGTVGVVMLEETSEEAGDRISVDKVSFKVGQNVLAKGQVIGKGQTLLPASHCIRAHDVGSLVEFGITRLKVFRRSRVGVLATGDELVDPNEIPLAGQIRNSNGTMLQELVKAAGGDAVDLGIGRDERGALNEKIISGLENDILLIAGGVSAGTKDLVPQCLAENGVEQVFHKVNLKPGKPIWFGKGSSGALVFGLPGNPVSSLVCFKLFVEPVIGRQAGSDSIRPGLEKGILQSDFDYRGQRRTFWPCHAEIVQGRVELVPLDWRGSADQVSFREANALISMEGMSRMLGGGEIASFIWL